MDWISLGVRGAISLPYNNNAYFTTTTLTSQPGTGNRMPKHAYYTTKHPLSLLKQPSVEAELNLDT